MFVCTATKEPKHEEKKNGMTKKCVCVCVAVGTMHLWFCDILEAAQFDKAPLWVFEFYLVLNKIAFWKTHLSSRSTMLLNPHFDLFFGMRSHNCISP